MAETFKKLEDEVLEKEVRHDEKCDRCKTRRYHGTRSAD